MLQEKQLTDKIIGAYYKVYNSLGYDFLENVYEKALAIELTKLDLKASRQQAIKVYYEGELVGIYAADIVVNDKVIIEIKAAEAIHPSHKCQLLNYLRATEIEIGLLLNFGPEPQFARKYFSNERKNLPRHYSL